MEQTLLGILREALEMNESVEISMTDKFREYENWDSLAQLSLIAALDEKFGIQLEQDVFKELHTINDLYLAINKGVEK